MVWCDKVLKSQKQRKLIVEFGAQYNEIFSKAFKIDVALDLFGENIRWV